MLQFERTLIIAEDDSEVSYLEGCTAPSYDSNQVCACSLLSNHCTSSIWYHALISKAAVPRVAYWSQQWLS